MVKRVPHSNKWLAWLGIGDTYVCDKHGDVTDEPFGYCFDCGSEQYRQQQEAAREARIEEMAEAFRRGATSTKANSP